jgi:hypothetical protein
MVHGVSIAAVSAGVLLALSGCLGSQPLVGAPKTIAQEPAYSTPAVQKKDLMYVATQPPTRSTAYVYWLTYPQGLVVGKIAKQVSGLCSDQNGNVYMTQSDGSKSTIYEYAHAGETPLATLTDPYGGARGCSIETSSGNLAVANSKGKTVVIYSHARGKPKAFRLSFQPYNVAYDPKGHLYAIGTIGGGFALLDNGTFRKVTLDKHPEVPIGVQWDGKYIALGSAGSSYAEGAVRQYTVTGLNGVEQGYVRLHTFFNYFYIDGSTIILSGDGGDIDFFTYPAGSSEGKNLYIEGATSVTVSLAAGSRNGT